MEVEIIFGKRVRRAQIIDLMPAAVGYTIGAVSGSDCSTRSRAI